MISRSVDPVSRDLAVMSAGNEGGESVEVEAAVCDCCGLTEECTLGYIERVRERYGGRWICGLCAEAVKDEICRSGRLITTEEALSRHLSFSESFRCSPNPAERLIAAMRQHLRRSIDYSRGIQSMPGSPRRRGEEDGGGHSLVRSESCMPRLVG